MGASVGSQLNWDALDFSGCLTFLLALSEKKIFLRFNKLLTLSSIHILLEGLLGYRIR